MIGLMSSLPPPPGTPDTPGSQPGGWAPPTPPPGPQQGWGQAPPPPGPQQGWGQGAPPAGPGGYPGNQGYPQAPGYPPGYGYPAPKRPRPKAIVGGALLVAAAVLVVIGTVLPWVTAGGNSVNGFDHYVCTSSSFAGDICYASEEAPSAWEGESADVTLSSPGIFGILGALTLLGFGLPLLIAGRILPVAILGLIAASIGVLASLVFVIIVARAADDMGASLGIGIWVQALGPIVGVIGGIIALVQRTPRAPAV